MLNLKYGEQAAQAQKCAVAALVYQVTRVHMQNVVLQFQPTVICVVVLVLDAVTPTHYVLEAVQNRQWFVGLAQEQADVCVLKAAKAE
jgi:hypothetical protein